jgi:hypothetical protein
LQDLCKADRVFHDLDISFLQAPGKNRLSAVSIDSQRTFAEILQNRGFGDSSELKAIASAWRNLYKLARPDLIVFDHSPTAMLATYGLGVKRALVGTGFFCPLDEYPMPDLRPWLPDDSARLKEDEDLVLSHANAVLSAWGREPLPRLSQLYQQVDENFLATFAELDHYPGRQGAEVEVEKGSERFMVRWASKNRSNPFSNPFQTPRATVGTRPRSLTIATRPALATPTRHTRKVALTGLRLRRASMGPSGSWPPTVTIRPPGRL